MAFFSKLVLSILMFTVGLLCMKYSVQITDQFSGKFDFAEKYLGVGVGAGTYTFWKLFGLGLCIISVLWLFNKISFGTPTPIEPTAFFLKLIVNC